MTNNINEKEDKMKEVTKNTTVNPFYDEAQMAKTPEVIKQEKNVEQAREMIKKAADTGNTYSFIRAVLDASDLFRNQNSEDDLALVRQELINCVDDVVVFTGEYEDAAEKGNLKESDEAFKNVQAAVEDAADALFDYYDELADDIAYQSSIVEEVRKRHYLWPTGFDRVKIDGKETTILEWMEEHGHKIEDAED